MKLSISITITITILFLLSYIPAIAYSSKHYTSIFSFGNSLADTGNLLITGATAFPMVGRLPYGMTYFGCPTGRFSNGRLVVDFIAQALGLPLLPPFLGGGKDFRKGVNFAVAGATALDPSFFIQRGLGSLLWTNYSLTTQVGWFQGLKPSLCHRDSDCSDYFERSLFLVGEIGGNDYNYPLVVGRISLEEVTTYVPKIVEAIANATQTLIDLGAIHLVVPGNLPIGCNPLYLTVFRSPNPTDYNPRTGCLNKLNNFSEYHNELLIEALQQLRLQNPRANIIYADYYNAAFQMDYFPVKYGFTHGVLRSCCGGGGGPYNFNTSEVCGLPGSGVIGNPISYLNWDGIHLTEAGYRNIAKGLLYGPYASPPIMQY